MRPRAWMPLFACAAMVLPAVAGPKVHVVSAAKIKGKPTFEDGKQVGLYAWADSTGFHVRWTSPGTPTLFTGRIDTDKPIRRLARVFEFGPGWIQQHGDRIVMFSSTTRGDTDGFDLEIPAGKRLQMEMTIDGATPAVETIFFGAKGDHPPGLPLLIYLP